MSKISKAQIVSATKLHQKSLVQAKKAAIAVGWDKRCVSEVANLEWSPSELRAMSKRERATTKQLNAILAVHDAAKFEMLGIFAQSQLR